MDGGLDQKSYPHQNSILIVFMDERRGEREREWGEREKERKTVTERGSSSR